jgi:amino acid transporter
MMPTYKPGYDSQVGVAVAIGLLWLCGFLNIFRVDKMGWVNGSAAVIHLSTIVILIVSVLAYPKVLNNGNFVFTDFYTDDYSNTNINDKSYVGAIGLLFGAFCFSGYEASGHMAEETNNAKVSPYTLIQLTSATIMKTCIQ